MHHNSKKGHTITSNKSSPSSSSSSNYSFSIDNKDAKNKTNGDDDNSINLIDILEIDKYSRLTLTKKVKKLLSLNTDDKIIIYQKKRENNRKNNNKKILLKIQRKNNIDSAATNDHFQFINGYNFVSYYDGINKDETNSVLEFDEDNVNNSIKDNKIQRKENENQHLHQQHHHLFKNEYTFYQTPIILIDDEPDLLLTFEYILKNEGYTNVKTFSDSKSLLKHLLDVDNLMYYKLAITDIRMPCINGIQLYQVLKILNPSIKIMFITSLDAANELSNIYSEVKSQDIIRKPVEGNQFVQMVNDKVKTI